MLSDYGVAKLIVQNGDRDSATYFTFKIEDSGKRLVYKETSCAIGVGPKTIVIAEDGSAILGDGEAGEREEND